MRTNPVKQHLREGSAQIGTWLSLANPVAARFLARTAFDWLTVDLEHSPVDWETAATIFAHVADAHGVPLARVPANRHDHIKRALDSGAWGIVVPMVMNQAEAQSAVAAMKYAPLGNRSVGGSLHAVGFGASPTDYYRAANDEILVVLQCEHIEAVRRADEIFSITGIDAIFVGPNDLYWSMRGPQGEAPSPEAFEATLQTILAACRRHQVAAGLHCFSAAEVVKRRAEGWQFLALGSDLSLLLDAATANLRELGLARGDGLANY